MLNLGLKSSTKESQIRDRLQYQPNVFEFFTAENDFTSEGLKRLAYDIEWVKSAATTKIILHHPMKFKGVATEIVAPQKQCPELYYFIDHSTNALLQLANDFQVQVLVHGAYSRQTENFIAMYPSLTAASQAVFHRLDHFKELGGKLIMFENSISPLFAYGDPAYEQEILAHNYRLAFDISHCFITTSGDNNALQQSLQHLAAQVVHYHLVDSLGKQHDSLTIGQGEVDWQAVMPLLNPQATNIFEIQLKDEENAAEQVASYRYLKKLKAN